MKKKLQNFANAAQIISQLPAGEIKNKAIDDLFGKSLSELELPVGSYIYRKTEEREVRTYQFVFSSDDDCDVVINATVGGEKETFAVVADIS